MGSGARSGDSILLESATLQAIHAVAAAPFSRYADLLHELEIATSDEQAGDRFLLVEREDRLELRPPGEHDVPGIASHCPPDPGRPTRGRNPLLRAFGTGLEAIFDLTAGFGADAFRLAAAGHRVFATERHPAVYAVLASAWAADRAGGRVAGELAERLLFSHGEGADSVSGIEAGPVGVYLDPMYPPPRRTRALPRRELQVLRRLLPEPDASASASLLAAARERAVRVVVKRPHRAAPLAPDASFEIASKLVRFDVYLNPSLMEGTAS